MKVAVLIDGGHLRVLVKGRARRKYRPDYIEKVAHACIAHDETLYRVFHYDCLPFNGVGRLPVSGREHRFTGSGEWLRDLERRDYFALRMGVLKFRGFKPKRVPIPDADLTDDDFQPDFEQKGVDMRIGLDIATFAATNAVDRIVLVTNDTDCIPAMKYGRRGGLQIVLVGFPGHGAARELLPHVDFHRQIDWPD